MLIAICSQTFPDTMGFLNPAAGHTAGQRTRSSLIGIRKVGSPSPSGFGKHQPGALVCVRLPLKFLFRVPPHFLAARFLSSPDLVQCELSPVK